MVDAFQRSIGDVYLGNSLICIIIVAHDHVCYVSANACVMMINVSDDLKFLVPMLW